MTVFAMLYVTVTLFVNSPFEGTNKLPPPVALEKEL